MIDRFSKAAHFITLDKLPTATETARVLTDHVFRLHGIPTEIVSARGPQFTSRVWKTFCTALGAKPCLSSGYHPQTNGQTERLNQELEATLRCITASNPASWSSGLNMPIMLSPLLLQVCHLLKLPLAISLLYSRSWRRTSMCPLFSTISSAASGHGE